MGNATPRAFSSDYPRLSSRALAPDLAAIAASKVYLSHAKRASYKPCPHSPFYLFQYPSRVSSAIFAAV